MDDKSQKISVIVPVYNVRFYLERCLESIVKQTYSAIEIILVDDGSTDGSSEICLKWVEIDDRIIYVSKKNGGLGSARNLGIKISKYQFITFVDSDDWLEDTFIETIYEVMEHENADIGMCDIYYVDNETMNKNVSKLRFESGVLSPSKDATIINKSRTFAWGKIYKKIFFEKHGILFPQITFEDIACIPVIVALADRIVYVSEPLYNYRRNRVDSLSNNVNNIGDIMKSLTIMEERFKLLGVYNDLEVEVKKIFIGQARFVYRKWGGFENLYKNKNIKEFMGFIEEHIPVLKDFNNTKFYVIDSILLKNAVDKVVFESQQVVLNDVSADYIICFESEQNIETYKDKKVIYIPDFYRKYQNSEIDEWNIAEIIMGEL